MKNFVSALRRYSGVVAFAAFTFAAQSGTSLAAETVTLLDRGEPYGAMIAEGGVFWVAQNRENFNSNYRLQAFNVEGQLVDQVAMSHAMWTMVKAQPGTIMMTGMNPSSRLTEYTTARLENGRIKFKTTEIALGGFINLWIGNISGKNYFVDMGGNPNDTQIGGPAQTIFSAITSQARYLSTRLRMPVAGVGLQNKLYLLSQEAIGSPTTSLVEVDPISMQKRVLTTSSTAKYSGLRVLPGTTDLVSSALDENKLVIVDSRSGEIRRELRTKGYTRSFDFYGHCVVAGDDERNIVEIFDLNSDSTTPFMYEEVNLPAEEFSGIKSIAVDSATGTIFARAALACNPMMEACDHFYNRVVTFGAEAAARLRQACQ